MKLDKSFLLVVIGSEAIRATVFGYDRKKESKTYGKPMVLNSFESNLPLLDKNDFKSLYDLTVKGLEDVFKIISSAKVVVPKEVHVVLESPWYISQTRMVSLEKAEPFSITKKFMMELKEKEHEIFRNEHKKDFTGEDDIVVEEKIMSTRLNGYDIQDPVGRKAKSFSMALYISITSKSAIDGFNKVFHRHIPHSNISYHSSAFSAYVVIRDIFAHLSDFLVVTVEGEVTDVHYVNSGVLFESVTFPYGLHSSIREMAKVLKHNVSDVMAFLRMEQENTLENTASADMKKALETSRQNWGSWFAKALDTLARGSVVPTNIFLISEGYDLQWVGEAIKNNHMHYHIGSLSFNLTEVDSSYLSGYYSAGIQTNTHADPMMHGVYIFERVLQK
ncbi:MAG: hypothetical protein R3B64_02265 [Candidatus Paceibacterota bacterium]